MLQKYSWYINSLQNVIIWSQEEKGLIALKLQYLFSFFPNPVTARLPPTALATFSLPSICTLWRVQFSNSILCTTAHIFIYSPFFQQNGHENKKYHYAFQMFYSREKKDHPGEVSQVYCDGARVITWISAIHDYASFTWAVYPLLLTYKHPVSTLPSFDQWTVQTLSHAL